MAPSDREVEWLDLRAVQERFSLPRSRVRELSRLGLVRSAKIGRSQQALRLYYAEDIRRYLRALAEGRKPRRRVPWLLTSFEALLASWG